MRKLAISALGALLGCGAYGQDLLECVNPDVVAALLGDFRSTVSPVVSTELPEQLAGYEAPAAFEWIGSMQTGSETIAAFRTDLAPADAEQQFLTALRQAGFDTWKSEDSYGFVLTGPPLYTSICRDGRRGGLYVRERAGVRFVATNFSTSATPQSCAEAMAPPDRSMSRAGFSYLPLLELPPSVLISRRPGAMPTEMNSGSNNTFAARVEVEGLGSVANLVGLLDQQITRQGWVAEASWSGEHSSGSAWTRTVDGVRLAGRLTVERIDGEHYQLEFKHLPMD